MDVTARLARGVGRELRECVGRVEAAVRRILPSLDDRTLPRDDADDALGGIDEAAALADQLAAVGRNLNRTPEPTQLRNIVRRTLPAIDLLAGFEIDISSHLDRETRVIDIDPSILSRVILYLVASSCSAVTVNGSVVISTRNRMLGAEEAARLSSHLAPGEWVVLEVRDDRVPIPSDLKRFFEPYNDPSRVGPAGLGLAAAHGLVEASGGVLIATVRPDGRFAMSAWFRPADPPSA
jgi:signal transduction histidine kinase